MLAFYENHPFQVRLGKGERLEFPMHMHREVEIFYLKEGSNTVNIAGMEHTLQGGELAIAFPGEPHSYSPGDTDKHLDLIFDPGFCPDFASVFKHYRPEMPFLKINAAAPDLKIIFDLLDKVSEIGRPDDKLIKGYLSIILFRIMEQLPLVSLEKDSGRDLTAKVVSHLMQNYQMTLSLESVAASLGVSKYEISRIFSHKIRMGFNQYLNRMRLEQAVYELISSEQSVTEIAFACGFESLRTFYRVFSAQYGMSPLAYRKKHLPQITKQTKE